MYLKSLKIKNFRKFGNKNNLIEFVDSKDGLAISDDVNVAKATSLIVGKNNAGKTTIITALDKVVNNQKFTANDFNFIYLNRLLNMYKKNHYNLKPSLNFEINIGIDERNHDDLVNNFVPFMQLGDSQAVNEEKDFTIIVKYELKNDEEFINDVKDLIENYQQYENVLFNKFLSLFDTNDLFEFNYYNSNDEPISTNFNIKNLIHIVLIKPNENHGEKDLSKIFSQIIKYKYAQDGNPNTETFKNRIELFNSDVSQDIENSFTNGLNQVIGKIHDTNTLQVFLSSNLSFELE